MPRSTLRWGVAAEHKLLLAVIEATDPKPPSWDIVASKMGEGYSTEACRQHFSKIKKGIAAKAGADGTEITPKKSKSLAATTPRSTKASGVKRKHIEISDVLNQDDEEEAFARLFHPDGRTKKLEPKPESDDREIIKVEDTLPDGSIDVDQDSLYD
ncbi:hypothetical protein MMC24_002663 [Lignoscripta atroalba]|nr:hypothetical protein [Lignoscripta atroalba]